MTEEIERLIVARVVVRRDPASTSPSTQGMVTLRQDGLAKVEAGHTTLEEVSRVVA